MKASTHLALYRSLLNINPLYNIGQEQLGSNTLNTVDFNDPVHALASGVISSKITEDTYNKKLRKHTHWVCIAIKHRHGNAIPLAVYSLLGQSRRCIRW